jgi:hypothetical protein
VFVESAARIGKERSMRRRKLKWLWRRLKELQRQRPTYQRLLMQLGAAKKETGRAFALVNLFLPEAPAKAKRSQRVDFGFTLSRARLRIARRREGRYLLRTNLTSTDPAQLSSRSGKELVKTAVFGTRCNAFRPCNLTGQPLG